MTDIKLKPSQIEAARMLAVGESITSTANKVGVSRLTVHRWLKENNNFIAFLNSLKIEHLETTRALIHYSSELAIKTIISLMRSSNSSKVRLERF